MSEKKIKVTLVKSVIGTKQDHRATVRGLGYLIAASGEAGVEEVAVMWGGSRADPTRLTLVRPAAPGRIHLPSLTGSHPLIN